MGFSEIPKLPKNSIHTTQSDFPPAPPPSPKNAVPGVGASILGGARPLEPIGPASPATSALLHPASGEKTARIVKQIKGGRVTRAEITAAAVSSQVKGLPRSSVVAEWQSEVHHPAIAPKKIEAEQEANSFISEKEIPRLTTLIEEVSHPDIDQAVKKDKLDQALLIIDGALSKVSANQNPASLHPGLREATKKVLFEILQNYYQVCGLIKNYVDQRGYQGDRKDIHTRLAAVQEVFNVAIKNNKASFDIKNPTDLQIAELEEMIRDEIKALISPEHVNRPFVDQVMPEWGI